MTSVRMRLFLDQRPALLQPGDDLGYGFPLGALVGCLGLGDPLTIERLARAAQHLPTGRTLLNPERERLALFLKLSQAGDFVTGKICVGAGERRMTAKD